MKKFLEELDKSQEHLQYGPTTLEKKSAAKLKSIYEEYKNHVGKRAMYSSGRNEYRLVSIEEVNNRFVRLSYMCYGRDYECKLQTCVQITALYCGDAHLDVER